MLTSSRRIKDKGWRAISRARTWSSQGMGGLPSSTACALRSPSTSGAPSPKPGHGLKEQLFAFIQEETRSGYEYPRGGYKSVVRRSSSSAAAPRRPAGSRHPTDDACRTSFDDGISGETCRDDLQSCPSTVRQQSGDNASEPGLVTTASSSSPSSPDNAPAARLSARAPMPRGTLHSKKKKNQMYNNNSAQPPSCKRRLPSPWSPTRTSTTATAAMACARGVGGRLGTPLGSPHPAFDKRIGSFHPSPPASGPNAAKKAKLANTEGGGSSALGSRYFPPFVSVTAPECGGGSPVVYEMVNDAADDEEDAIRRGSSSGTASSTSAEQGGVRELGWNGFTLYR